MWSILERLLVTERIHRRATRSGDFARPLLHESPVPAGGGPYVASDARLGLVLVRPSSKGVLRSGFSQVDLEDEPLFFATLFTELWNISATHSWPNRCGSISEGFSRMTSFGMDPQFLVVSQDLVQAACGVPVSDAEQLMRAQGYIAEVRGARVLASAHLAPSAAVISTTPALVGTYTRADDCVSVLIHQADRTLVLVRDVLG